MFCIREYENSLWRMQVKSQLFFLHISVSFFKHELLPGVHFIFFHKKLNSHSDPEYTFILI